jgi:VCBS repeat-containing protein
VVNTLTQQSTTLYGVEGINFQGGPVELNLAANVLVFDGSNHLVGTFATIQAGVDFAQNGYTVEVRPGTYNENVVIEDDGIKLISRDGSATTTIAGVQSGSELGTIQISSNADNVKIGAIGHGFTVLGLNGNGVIEKAAIYIQGNHEIITIQGNVVTARGDEALMTEVSATIRGLTIDRNTFNGQTFEGSAPQASGDQFALDNNIPRGLVVIGNGGTGRDADSNPLTPNVWTTTGVSFTNNLVTGVAGGVNGGVENGNTLVTIDATNSNIANNTFEGFTNGYGAALRARGPNTNIAENVIDNRSSGSESEGYFIDNHGTSPNYNANVLYGSSAGEILRGTPGGDTINGGDGNDIIIGGKGNDNIKAGDGDDTIVYTVGDGADRIDGGTETGTAFPAYDVLQVVGDAEARQFSLAKAVNGNNIAPAMDRTDILVGYTGTGATTVRADEIERVVFNLGSAGDTVTIGDVSGTAIAPSTVVVNGGAGSDTIDLTGLVGTTVVINDTDGVAGGDTDLVNLGGKWSDYAVSLNSATNEYTITRNSDGAVVKTTNIESFDFTGDTSGAISIGELVNVAPVAGDDVASVKEAANGIAGIPTATGNVLANDNDANSLDTEAVVSVTFGTTTVGLPADNTPVQIIGVYGTLTIQANGTYTYVLDNADADTQALKAGETKAESFSYVMQDTAGLTDTAALTINVIGTNDAPVAVADAYTTSEDTPLTISQISGVLSNDTDVEGNPLSAVLVSGPAHGSLTLNTNGSFSYTPTLNYNGFDSFSYRANDGLVNSALTTVTLNVTPVNDAPVTANISAVGNEDTVIALNLSGSDIDGSVTGFVINTLPVNGTLYSNAGATQEIAEGATVTGPVYFKPVADYYGPASFTYSAKDNGNLIDATPATATIQVNKVYFSDDFSDNSAGWSLGKEWQIGAAKVSSGQTTGNPDPAFDNTPTSDNGVAGVVIGGNAQTGLHAEYYLVSPVIDTSGASTLALSYARWLNSDYTPYMKNTVDVWNGTSWVNIWSTGSSSTVDSSWTPASFDITAYANAQLQVRFGFSIGSSGVWTMSSWNLDDILISGKAASLSDPIILDLDHNGIALTSLEHGVVFDINADGAQDHIAWTAGSDGILAFDVNGNGKIDNGSEIFSPDFAGGKYVDGLAALATLDTNHDGKVDASDADFGKLLVWQDLNHDGVSDVGELSSLTDHAITSLSLDTTATDLHIDGQQVLAQGSYSLSDGSTGSFVEVAFDTSLGQTENTLAADYSLIGSDGDDTLYGGAGLYTMTGGAGADTFVLDADAFKGIDLADVITDYKASEGDVLDISNLLTSLLGHEASEADALANVKTSISGTDTVVSANDNGTWHDVAVLQDYTSTVKVLYDDDHNTTTTSHTV